jgi:hypothetical protein
MAHRLIGNEFRVSDFGESFRLLLVLAERKTFNVEYALQKLSMN